MKGEDGDYCSDGTGDEDGDGRTNVSSNSNNSNNNTTTNNNSNVPRFQNSSDENRTNRDEASRSSNNSSLLRYPGNNGNNVDEVIGAVIVSSIENVVDDFRRPIVVPTREIISEGNDNVMKTTAAAAAATATATSEQITRTNNNTTTPMINPTSLNTSYNNNTNNNNDEMNINLLNITDDSFFEIASLDVASSENTMDISLIHKNNWPSFFDGNMAKDDDDEDDDGGKNKCNFGVEEGRKEGEKKVVVGRGNDNNGDDDLSSPLSNLRNTSASINDVDLSFSRTDHDSDLLSSPPLVLGNNDSTVMNDDLDISFISNSSNGILGNNKYKHYTNLAIINNNNSNTNNNNSVIDSDVLVEDNSSIHQQSSEIPLFTSSSSSSSPKPHPNPMMQQQQQQQQQHQQVNINNNPQQQQQQQQQHHQNNDHQNINQEEQQEDQQHHYGLPLPPRQFSSAPTAREQLIERERQARLERERARLKMQMAHSREQQRDEGSYVSDDDDDIQDGDGAGGGIGNGIAGNGIGGGNNIGGDDKDNKSNGNNNGKEKINNDVIGFSMERFLSASPGGNNNSNTNIISNNNIIVTSNNIAVTGLSSSMAISRIILPATTTSNTNATIATSIHANEDILPRDARNDNDHDNNNNISGSDRSDIVGGSGQLTEHEILEMAEIDHASLGNVPPRSERSLYEITSVVSSNDDNDNGGMDDHHDDNNNDKDSIRMGRHHSLTAQEILEMTEIDHASLGNVPPRSERAFSESSVLLPPLNDDGDSCDNHVHDENGGNNDDDDIDSGKGRRHSQSSVILTEQEILEMAEIERASVGNVPPRSVRSLSESTVDHNNDNKQQSSNNNHSSDHHIRSTNIVLQGNIDRPAQKLTELDLKKMTETDRASVENVPPRSVRSLSETSAAAPINHDRDHDNGNDENSTTHHITTVNDVANRNNRILEFDRISSESDIRANNNNNNNNNNINNEHGGGPPRRLAQLTEQEILEMTEIEDASVGNVPPRSIRSLSESSTLMDPIVTNTMGERSDSSRGEGNSLHHHHTMSNMDGSNGGSNLILDHDDDCPIPRVAQLTEQEILEMAEIDDASVGNEPPRSVRSLSETSASIEVPTGSTHAFIDAEDNIPVTIVGVSSCDSRGNDGGNDPSLGRGLPRSSFLDGSNHVKMTLEGDGTRPTLGNYSISVHGNGNGNGEGLNLSSFLLPGGTNINRYKNVPNREDRVNELMEGLIGGGTKNDGNNPPSSVYVMDGSAQEYNSKNEYHSYGAMHENMENQVSGSASRGVPTHVDICDIHNSDSEEVLPLLNSSSSRRINHRKIPVDHILNNVFSTLRSESAADTEADISYSDRYLTKGIIKRAFPERFIVLMMTLVIEMPIFYMISMESDMLCTELGRRRYQILIAFVPVTCAISGNCGVQVCSLTSKAIRHNTRLTKATFYSWILSELYVSVLLGIVVGIILGLLAYLTGEFDLLLGAAIFSSICTGIILAGLGGTLAPLIFTFLFHRDSGRMGILLQTAIQDVVGTFTMLGLSYFIITQFGESNIDSNNLCGT